MSTKTQANVAIGMLLFVLVAIVFVISSQQHASANTTIVSKNSQAESMTVVPSAVTYSTPMANGNYGETQYYINPTALPTAENQTIGIQRSYDGLTWMDVTPTVINGTTTMTYGQRLTPFVAEVETYGSQTRFSISSTGATTYTQDVQVIGINNGGN